MHVATSSIEKLLDYVMNTPEDGFTSEASVKTITEIIEKNLSMKNITERTNEDQYDLCNKIN